VLCRGEGAKIPEEEKAVRNWIGLGWGLSLVMCCDRSLKVSDQNLKYRGKSLKQLSKWVVMDLFCDR
jgi:hypothetical protein